MLIKVVYCTAYLGLVILLPYLTLQALTLGLTYEDISIIYGITPALTFMTSPLSGKKRPMPLGMELEKQSSFQHSGFIGDKIGYRPVLIFNMLLTGLAATSFTFMPIYKEYMKVPHAILYKSSKVGEELTAVPYTLFSVVWSVCNEEVTESKCSMWSIEIVFTKICTKIETLSSQKQNYSFKTISNRISILVNTYFGWNSSFCAIVYCG